MNLKIFQYCPKCSQKSLFQKAENLVECSSCNLHWYQEAKPCVNIILKDNKGNLLFGKRKVEPSMGKWGIVGGFCDLNETIEQAMIREIEEEIGLKLDVSRLIYMHNFLDRYQYQDWNYYIIVFVFIATLDQNEISKIKPNDDVSEVKWVQPNKILLPEFRQDLDSKSTVETLDFYLKNFDLETKNLIELREMIDLTDTELVKNLAKRQQIVDKIGKIKKQENMKALQPSRWQEVLDKNVALGQELGLSNQTITKIWEIIHQDSLDREEK